MHFQKKVHFFFETQATFLDLLRLIGRNKNMKTDFEQIFNQAKKKDRTAQKALFDGFAPKMLAVAKSYVNTKEDAEDVLMHSFVKVFSKLDECRGADSFGGWLRRIVINEAISFIRKNKNVLYVDEDVERLLVDEELSEDFDFNLQEVLQQMPLGYKLVFNLFVFEDKRHAEISEILNISEGTSRSQLNKAKKWLLEFFKNKEHERFNEK